MDLMDWIISEEAWAGQQGSAEEGSQEQMVFDLE
jgi:hypothetical protein